MEAKWEEQAINWIVGGIGEAISAGTLQEEQNRAFNRAQEEAGLPVMTNSPQVAKQRGEALKALGERIYVDNTGPLGVRAGAISGVAPIRFQTLLYINPEYKHYSFQWNLSPRNKQESETIRRIVNVFKKAMQPTVRYSLLWGYPCVFRIMFRPNNEQLYKFRPCILKRFVVNYTPLGRAAFYNTVDQLPNANKFGATEQGNPPEGIVMQAAFQEIEYWTQERMSETPERAMSLSASADDPQAVGSNIPPI